MSETRSLGLAIWRSLVKVASVFSRVMCMKTSLEWVKKER